MVIRQGPEDLQTAKVALHTVMGAQKRENRVTRFQLKNRSQVEDLAVAPKVPVAAVEYPNLYAGADLKALIANRRSL